LLLFCSLLWISLPYSNTYRNLRDGVWPRKSGIDPIGRWSPLLPHTPSLLHSIHLHIWVILLVLTHHGRSAAENHAGLVGGEPHEKERAQDVGEEADLGVALW
jgi:hypothetical protein